ncbi:hypothetical protein [Acinetobacter modestus]|uniref:hypothetical protein n=1 Tax=Acinetobacter modestus TaxID=1776740 RepID=UPI003016EB05
MKSFFVRHSMDILNASMQLGIDLALNVDYPEQFIINLPNEKMLLVPIKRWVVIQNDFVSILTDEEYKNLYA